MLASLQRFFSIPVFPDDEDKTRSARVLAVILNTLLLIVPVVALAGLLTAIFPPRTYAILGAVFISMIGLRWFLQRGVVKSVGSILVVVLFVTIGGSLLLSGTVRSPTVIFLILTNVIAGLGVGRRASFWMAIGNALFVIGFVWAENAGLLPTPTATVGVAQIITFSIGSFLTAVLLNLSLQSVEESLGQARRNEQTIRELATTLEQRVIERSNTLSEALRIAHLGNWEYDLVKDEFTFNDDFYAMMRTTPEREGGYKMNAARYTERFVHPEDAPIVGAEIVKAIETTDPNFRTQVDHRVTFGDGEIGYVTVRFRIEKDTQGRTVKSFGANQDITERKRIEIALAQKEVDLSEALRIAQIGNWEYDFLKDEFTFNDDFYTMMRTTAEREGGYKMNAARYTERFVYPEDAPIVGIEIGKSIETTDPNFRTQVDHRVIFGDGEIGYVTVRFQIEKDPQGRTIKSFGANQDITEPKNTEVALATNEAQLSEALRTARLGNWEYDFLKDEFTFNDDFYTMMRTTAEREGGYKMNAARYTERFVYPEDAPIVGIEIGKSIETTDPNFSTQVDHRVIFGDGEIGYVTVRFRIEKDAQGHTVKSFGANQDITERKIVETIVAKRATELETVTQVSTSIAALQDLQQMLLSVSELTKQRFNFYHAHVYLLDVEDGMLELAAGAGEAGQKMVANKHAIPLNREQSLVARAARTHQGVLVNDITLAPDFLPNPLLPDTRAELAVPLILRDKVLGVLDVQSTQVGAFTDEDIKIQTILASQIAVALENARANEQGAKTLQELNILNRRLIHEGWKDYLSQKEQDQLGYIFQGNELSSLTKNGEISSQETQKTLIQPVLLRGEQIGQLKADGSEIEDEELAPILVAISEGLSSHLENLRLTEEAERRANELSVVNEIGQVLTDEVDLQQIIIAVTQKLSQRFRANVAYIALYNPAHQRIDFPYMLAHDQETLNEPSLAFGEGVTSTIIKTRQSIFVNRDTERHLTTLGALPSNATGKLAKSFIGVPMIVNEQVLGVINIQDADQEGRFTEGDVRLLETIAANVAVALQNARLFADAQKRAEREAKLNLIGQKIQSATTVQGALQTAIQELGLALKARHTSVELLTKSADKSMNISAKE